MSGIDCLSHYCTVVRYQHLKSDLTVILRIGDMIKLLWASFLLWATFEVACWVELYHVECTYINQMLDIIFTVQASVVCNNVHHPSVPNSWMVCDSTTTL